MIGTEDQARTWLCPMTFNSATLSCIASNCAAWRWHHSKTDRGYCGMAGKPADAETPTLHNHYHVPPTHAVNIVGDVVKIEPAR